MKKLFTILFALLTINVAGQVKFGVLAGVNGTSLSYSGFELPDFFEMSQPNNFHFGINLGGFTYFSLVEFMQLKTGLIYSEKGETKTFARSGGFFITSRDRVTCNVDYIEIPIEVAFKMGDVFALNVGTYGAYTINKNIILDSDDRSTDGFKELEETINKNDIDNDISELDFGLNLGATFTLSEHFFIAAKYSMGIVDISEVSVNWPLDGSGGLYSLKTMEKQGWKNKILSLIITN